MSGASGSLTRHLCRVPYQDIEVEHETDLDLPLNELITGKAS